MGNRKLPAFKVLIIKIKQSSLHFSAGLLQACGLPFKDKAPTSDLEFDDAAALSVDEIGSPDYVNAEPLF